MEVAERGYPNPMYSIYTKSVDFVNMWSWQVRWSIRFCATGTTLRFEREGAPRKAMDARVHKGRQSP